MEPCFRQFLRDAARSFLEDDRDAVRDAYFDLGDRIRRRDLPPKDFTQWAMLNEETLAKHAKLQRLLARSASNGGPVARSGDRLELYEREEGELGLIAEYANDESTASLLRRLRDVAGRFRSLFESEAEFEAFFPPLSMRTDLAAAREQQAVAQLGLFG